MRHTRVYEPSTRARFVTTKFTTQMPTCKSTSDLKRPLLRSRVDLDRSHSLHKLTGLHRNTGELTSGLAKFETVWVKKRVFFIDNLLVRIHFNIVMIRWTGLTPWEAGPPASRHRSFPFPSSRAFTFRVRQSYRMSLKLGLLCV